MTFYICSVSTGFYLCKDQEWLPWYMGGHGTLELSFVNQPFYKIDPMVLNYGLVLLGFQLEQFCHLLLVRKRESDYEEMLVHDMLTSFLYFGYLTPNLVPIGTVVLLLHDLTDIPMKMSKLWHEMGDNEIKVALFFFIGQVMWAWFRLFAFPMVIWSLHETDYQGSFAQFNSYFIFCKIFLCMLVCMHAWWFYLFMPINAKII